ncbi:hypothetical protein X777_13428 [Ooceraea biroi]|uniref:Uncharacterized protein n=1 Tax=Ooceraea biroi TaxID=2015173 RepID=A0A026WYX0_OOCBI|nr:hypothetical protein X777_13428 [Ooceraea biroi]
MCTSRQISGDESGVEGGIASRGRGWARSREEERGPLPAVHPRSTPLPLPPPPPPPPLPLTPTSHSFLRSSRRSGLALFFLSSAHGHPRRSHSPFATLPLSPLRPEGERRRDPHGGGSFWHRASR